MCLKTFASTTCYVNAVDHRDQGPSYQHLRLTTLFHKNSLTTRSSTAISTSIITTDAIYVTMATRSIATNISSCRQAGSRRHQMSRENTGLSAALRLEKYRTMWKVAWETLRARRRRHSWDLQATSTRPHTAFNWSTARLHRQPHSLPVDSIRTNHQSRRPTLLPFYRTPKQCVNNMPCDLHREGTLWNDGWRLSVTCLIYLSRAST